jgi:hypothetical protein
MSATVATVADLPRAASGVECRVWERFSCDVPASCQPVAARHDRDVQWPGTLRDVSAKGVGLVLGRRYERGAALAIELPETAGRPADTLLVRVVHVKALPEGTWLHGCSLVSELSEDELGVILRRSEAAPQPPAAGKHVIPGVVLRWAGAAPGGRVFRARRLFLKGRWPLPAGTVLRVRTGDAAGRPWLRLRVHRCEERQGQWTVTCALLGQPPAGTTLVLRRLKGTR